METAEDVKFRSKWLEGNLSKAAFYQRALFELFSMTSYLLMVIAIGCSAGAAVYGFLQHGTLAGVLALIPPIAVIAAVNLRIDARKDWHSRKYHAVNTLLYRLRFELPPNPTLDQIALLAKDYMEINVKFRQEFKECCEFSWTTVPPIKP
jgi:hypothetical protein